MSRNTSSAVVLSSADSVTGFCLLCGKSMKLNSFLQRFCSDECKESFISKMALLRRKKRSEYQRQFRTSSYKTRVKHVEKITCPKCNQTGYLVRYTVRNVKSGKAVSVYETVRHQVTQHGKSILKRQCYIRSLPRGELPLGPGMDVGEEAHKSLLT